MLSFLLFLPLVICSELPEFTDDNFDVEVNRRPFTLVMFYAPWCGHCKQFKPHFIAAGKELATDTDNAALALVDCTSQEKTCTKFGVSGYPTVKLFQNGKHVHDFDGGRDKDGVINYMMKRSKPPSTELTSADRLKELLDSKPALTLPVIVGYSKAEDKEWLNNFKSVASNMLGKAVFAHSHDPAVLGLSGDGSTLHLYRPKLLHTKLEPSEVNYLGEMSAEGMESWIQKNMHGIVGYRTRNNADLFKGDRLVFYHTASLEKYPKGVTYYRNRLIKIIEALKTPVPLVYSYCSSSEFTHELSDFGMSEDAFPIVVIYSDDKRYKLDSYAPEALTDFIEKFHAKSLTAYTKSEPIPTDQPDAALKVVGNTFEKVVNDPTKDVFIVFHAPWCGHCKQLLPVFSTIAEKLKGESNLVMATYDATANEIFKPYEVSGYPTLYFVPKNKKHEPKRYEGAREANDLLKFIARESTDELIGYSRSGEEKKSDL